MKNPWYWKCEECGNIQPAHPDTKPEEMGTCRKRVETKEVEEGLYGKLQSVWGFCGGAFIKHKATD